MKLNPKTITRESLPVYAVIDATMTGCHNLDVEFYDSAAAAVGHADAIRNHLTESERRHREVVAVKVSRWDALNDGPDIGNTDAITEIVK